MRRPLRRVLKVFTALALLGFLAVAALVLYLWLEQRSVAALPAPTGPFAVGRAIRDWADPIEVDTVAPVPGAKRELLVWIWYPAETGPLVVADDYLPAELRPKPEPADRTNPWTYLTRDVANVRGHSAREPEVSLHEKSYPVVILRAGASAPVLNYSTLAEDLASHGYVVVGFDAP